MRRPFLWILLTLTAAAPAAWAQVEIDLPPDLPSTYYVDSASGQDGAPPEFGTLEQPFATLRYAVQQANLRVSEEEGNETWNVYLIASETSYQLAEWPLELMKGVNLLGWNRPVISLLDNFTHIGLNAGAKIRGIEFVIDHEMRIATAVRILGIFGDSVELTNCWFFGQPGFDTTAVAVGGLNWRFDQSRIAECTFTDFDYGVVAAVSGINITRCTFEGIAIADVWVVNTLPNEEKQSGFTVPMLGDKDDVEDTGLNNFQGDGTAVQNDANGEVQAENNYWGTDDPAEIAGRTSGGDVNTSSFLSKSVGPGTVVVNLVGNGGNPVPDTANPTCTINGAPVPRDGSSQNFIASGVATGPATVQAQADGFNNATQQVTVSALNVTPVQINMIGQGGTGGCGGKSGAVAYACCGLVIMGLGRSYRRRRNAAGNPKT